MDFMVVAKQAIEALGEVSEFLAHTEKETCREAITNLRAAIEQMEKQESPQDFISLLREAEVVVKSKSVYKRFIDGTPLDNDVPVWMADFAMIHAVFNPAPAVPEGEK